MTEDPVGAVEKFLLPMLPERLGVAVSGGGDSVALLHLVHGLCAARSTCLHVVTVDHGLRSGSAEESAGVARLCADLNLPHTILTWKGWDGQGNLQNEARRARYRLIAAWAKARAIGTVLLGHTADDQAETVLMRLARGAGVDGLSAMSPRRMNHGIAFQRPLLLVSRKTLRSYLKTHGVHWIEDPSNEDTRFDRIKMRQALQHLEPLGIDTVSLGQVAFNMALARDALDWNTFVEARRLVSVEFGAIRIDWRTFRTLPDEIARRMLVQAIQWVAGTTYPPRRQPLLALLDTLKRASGGTLEGCHARRFGESLWVFREYNAVRDLRCDTQALWDGHWRVDGKVARADLHIGVLSDSGLAQCCDWRNAQLPRDVLMVMPAVWSGGDLVATPVAKPAPGWHFRSEKDEEGFFAALLSH